MQGDDVEAMGEGARGDYWNLFYRARAETLAVPSQFALFALGEAAPDAVFVDLGCGTGRDAIYFASTGRRVVGVDGSEAAVEHCRKTAEKHGVAARFLSSAIDAGDLVDRVKDALGDTSGPTTVYARFFIHAINDAEEKALLASAARLCGADGMLAVEFRTRRDASLAKVTGAHYRRFVDPQAFIANAAEAGFECRYFVEGFGYAKYKDDDAHVARCILTRRG